MNESDKRLEDLGLPMHSNWNLFLSCLLHVLTKSQLVECFKVLLEECLHLRIQLGLHLDKLSN